MTENMCEHIYSKNIKCCGGAEREIIWCKKYDRHYEAIVCQKCKGGSANIPTASEKYKNIVKCYSGFAIDAALKAIKPKHRSKHSRMVEHRLDACCQCEHRTYISIAEYNKWIRENGGYLKFVNEIDRLNDWRDLPDNKDKSGGDMFCRRCKCLLSAKAHSKDEKCPMGNQSWLIVETENG